MIQGQSNMHVQGPQINQFNNIAPAPIPRSAFIRDFTRRSTFNSDYLVPIFVDEILPGDDIHVKMNAFIRLTTPKKPIMDNLYAETFWFFVPNRIVWDNWEKFQGQQTNPGDSVAYTIPKLNPALEPISTTGFECESIYDYFGLPILVNDLDNINSLYFRAYNMIYNDWFRDENLQNALGVNTSDGPDNPGLYALMKRNKRKDYFTSALPWPQKGTAVSIPLAGSAPIVFANGGQLRAGPATYRADTNASAGSMQWGGSDTRALSLPTASPGGNPQLYLNGVLDTDTLNNSYANLAAASPVTINALRQAALYQQILELDARGGTRYVESIFTRFGVISPDFRLQRPELIGQGSSRINVYAVPQTSATVTDETPQGNLAAFGTLAINGTHGCRYAATEHGMVIGLINVRADLTYQQGIPKMFSRRTRLDFYEPLLNGLGEQSILNKELFAQGTADDELVFGYQERFAEYRFKNSEITGKFRSTYPQSLDIWHLSQELGGLPVLNGSWVEETVPMERVLAITDESDFLMDIAFNYKHVRPMPIRSNPGITRL